ASATQPTLAQRSSLSQPAPRLPALERTMKTAFVSGLTILAAATALLTASVASADASCKPRLIEKQTSFPLTAQLRGQEGTVYMNVIIDENGRAQRLDLQCSS